MFKLFLQRDCLPSMKRNNLLNIYCAKCRYKCYYSVLGLNSNATYNEIKAAYYRLSQQFHPDKNDGCENASRKFREISEAYETLSNANKKMKYDEEVRRSQYVRNYDRFTHETVKQRPFFYEEPPPPRTGKSKMYDYDEHFRLHYERMKKAQEEHYKIMRDAQLRWQRDKAYRNFRHETDEMKEDVFSREDYRLYFNAWFLGVFMLVFFVIPLVAYDVPPPKDRRVNVENK